MEEIVTILSTREWAIAIWGTGFFVWMLTQREIRKSLWNVIKILLGKNLRHFFLIIALYVAGITMIFYQLPFWNNIYLKDIILWLIFSGISYCVNSIIKGDAEHLKSTVKDNFRVIVIFEYFIGTFNIIIKDIKENRVVLPDFQRGFVWKDKNKQKALIASILTRIPIGSILLLETKGSSYKYKKIGMKNIRPEIDEDSKVYFDYE